MRKQLGDRLPEFTPEEAELVKGSNDFYGMNHYCANYIKHKDTEPELDDNAGNLEILMQNKKGEWIGPETQSVWLRPMPLGFRKLIKWLSDRYGGPTFYVTENGTSLKGENELPVEELLNDEFRVEYFRGYIGALADAHTLDGVDVRGYSAWSLMEYVNPTFLTSTKLFSKSIVRDLERHLSFLVSALVCRNRCRLDLHQYSADHHVLTVYLQQFRVGRRLHDTIRGNLCGLQGRPKASSEEECARNLKDL